MIDLSPHDLVHLIRVTVGRKSGTIALHEPTFRGREKEFLSDCVESGWVSSVGKYVDEFEARLRDFTGVGHAVACVNGTAALHMCLKLAGVLWGEEVLMPALTFVGTANAAAHAGAVPHFVDCEAGTLGVDAAKLEAYLRDSAEIRGDGCYNSATGRRIRALVVVHIFGHPADVEALGDTCAKFKIELIEDAAESLGSLRNGRHTGTFAKLAALSFNGNKIVTTGGGGAILTKDAELAARAKHLTTTAKLSHRWEFRHDRVGYNYRLPNVNAALGCAQMEQLPAFLKAKRALASAYRVALDGVPNVKFLEEPAGCSSNYWLNAIIFNGASAMKRDTYLATANDAGIGLRPVWILMHKLPMYADCPRSDLSVSEAMERAIVNLPSGASLAGAEA